MATAPRESAASLAGASTARSAPDYFGRLAEQAVQAPRAPPLVPRIASRFEPGSAGDAGEAVGLREVESWIDAEPASMAGAVDEASPASRPARGRAAGHGSVAPLPVPRHARSTASAEPAGLQATPPTVEATPLEAHRSPAPADDAQRTTHLESESSHAVDRAAPRRVASRDEPADGRPAPRAGKGSSAEAPALAIGTVARLDPAPAWSPPETASSPRAAAAGEPSAPAREASTRTSERGAPAPVAPPPVEIHIDRIEVRGYTPAAAPVAYPAASPNRGPIGLDELLRRRRGEPA